MLRGPLARTLGGAYRHRHLVAELVRREIGGRYVSQALGVVWAWIGPLLLMGLYVLVFRHIYALRQVTLAGMPANYTVFVLSGLVPWLAMQDLLARAPDTFVAHASYIRQSAFPLAMLPVVRALASLPILLAGTAFLVLYMIAVDGRLPATLLLWPVYLALHVLVSCAFAFLLGTIGVFLRDLREIVTFLLAANLFLLPILYPPEQVPTGLHVILLLNPFSHLVWVHQDLIVYGAIAHPASWLILLALASGAFVAGTSLFARLHDQFAEAV